MKKVIVAAVIILSVLVLALIFIINNKIVYWEAFSDVVIIVKEPDGSLPGLEGDKHNLLVYENKLFGKKLLDERFLFRDGLMVGFKKYNIHIEFSEKSALITIHGSQMDDKVYTCSWD